MKFSVLTLLLVSMLVSPSAQASPADNWIFVQVRGGPEGAFNANFSLDTRAKFDGSSPAMFGQARMWPGHGEEAWVGVDDYGGSGRSVDVSRDGMRYHFDAGPGLEGNGWALSSSWHREVAPNEVLSSDLFFYAGGTFSEPPVVKAAAGTGSLIVTTVIGGGATSIPYDEASARDGIVVGPLAVGTFDHRASMPTGIVGGMIDRCFDCTASWTDPAGRTSSWNSTYIDGSPDGEDEGGQATFSGPPGSWQWRLEGTRTFYADTEPVLVAYAPIGDLWNWFPVEPTP